MAMQAVKTEDSPTVDDHFRAPGLCDDTAVCHTLAASLHRRAPHSVVEVKAYQRDCILGVIADLLRTRQRVNIYLFDDWLLRPGALAQTLLTTEIVMRFRTDRVAVWSPNLDPDIVASLRVLADAPHAPTRWLTAGCGSAV